MATWRGADGGAARTRRLLARIFRCDVRRSAAAASILTDFYMFALVFARERAFSNLKTSALLSIAHDVVTTDTDDALRSAPDSFAHLADLIRRHACERSPHRCVRARAWACVRLGRRRVLTRPPPWRSAGIFGLEDVKSILEYLSDSYYRHFSLYKYALAKQPQLSLAQTGPCGVDGPAGVLRPLTEAFCEPLEPRAEGK